MKTDLLRYKYLPCNEGSLSVLSDGTMKFTSPKDFNDPFDCAPDFDPAQHSKYIATRSDLIKNAGYALGLSPAQRIQKKPEMIKRYEKAVKSPEYGGEFTSRIGICSLSRDPLNLLMWAHYAESHTGFVVEFSIPTSAMGTHKEATDCILKWLYPQEVKYAQEKPSIDPFDDRLVSTEKHFLVKSADWEYEQEERVVDFIRGHGIHPYDRERVLKSVIAGMRMKEEEFDELKLTIEALNKELATNVTLHRARPLQGKFALYVPDRLEL